MTSIKRLFWLSITLALAAIAPLGPACDLVALTTPPAAATPAPGLAYEDSPFGFIQGCENSSGEQSTESKQTCPEQNGIICASDETCSNSWLDASDSGRRCRGICSNQPTDYEDSPFGAHGYYNIITDISNVGIKYKRNTAQEGIVWGIIEPGLDGNYDWDGFDSNLETAESLGLTLTVNIKSFHEDDQECHAGRYCIQEGKCRYNPCDWDKYETFLTAVIQRYGNRVKYWQIENEPREGGGYFSETPEGYAKLLSISYDVIKNTCSDCNVLIAGIWNDEGFEYYDQVFTYLEENNLQNSFDIFDIHTGADHNTIEEVCNKITTLLSKYGYSDKPIWSTEFGPLNPQGQVCVIPDDIGDTLIKNFAATLSAGFEKLFWRVSECPSWITSKDDGKTDTYYAYQTLISKLEGFSSVNKIADEQYVFGFSDKNPVYILWCDSGACPISSEITGTVKVTDYLGDEEIKDAEQITLGESPIFIEKAETTLIYLPLVTR